MFDQGWITIARWRGTPLRLHWTVLLAPLVFTRLRFLPGYWAGVLALIVLHELGHAWWVRRFGMEVLSVDAHGFGGWCRWRGLPTPLQRAVIAWGGVLAQALVLVVAFAVFRLAPGLSEGWGWQIESALVNANLWLIGFNLLPIPPLDGAEAWKILGLLRGAGRFVQEDRSWREPPRPVDDSGVPLAGATPPDPVEASLHDRWRRRKEQEAAREVAQLDALEDDDIPQELKDQVDALLAGLDGRIEEEQ